MSSMPASYDALLSETVSMSQTPCQSKNQLSYENVETSPLPPTPSPPYRTCIPRFWTNWEWEYAAFFLVLTTPIIIFSTLYPHDGRPLPQWPFKISINSLLSVYALVFKAAIGFILTSCIGQLQWTWFSETRPLADMLLFDNATRGADGALGLIWRQRFRQPLTALGCIIMILAVAIDPFIQQLVRPVDCSVEVLDDHATLPRANVFEASGYDGLADPNTAKSSGDYLSAMGRAVDSALYNAFYSPGQDPPWQCSTGNCTFPTTYGTIGVCSSCQDESAHVIVNSTCSHPDSSYASHHPTSGGDCPADSSFTVESNFTVSEYISLSAKMNISSFGMPDSREVADAEVLLEPVGSGYLGGVRNLHLGFLIGATANTGGRIDWTTTDNSTCSSNASEKSWTCRGYGAATCYLQPCVQIYNATISAGVLEEYLVASSSDAAWGMVYDDLGMPLYLSLIDTQCPAEFQSSPALNSSVESRWLPYNFNLTGTSSSTSEFRLPNDITSLLDNGCLYLMSFDSMMVSVEQYLSGKVQVDGYGLSGTVGGQKPDGMIFDMSSFEGPELVRNIYNWGHTDLERIQSIFANISGSLTTYIRTHGGTYQLPGSTNFSRDVHGKVYRYATCLEVQWPWISFSASLAVFTAMFFLTVVEATRRRGTSIWKFSPLVWILRTDGRSNERCDSSTRLRKGMKERSRQISVHLLDDRDSDGPHIRMADLKDPNLL